MLDHIYGLSDRMEKSTLNIGFFPKRGIQISASIDEYDPFNFIIKSGLIVKYNSWTAGQYYMHDPSKNTKQHKVPLHQHASLLSNDLVKIVDELFANRVVLHTRVYLLLFAKRIHVLTPSL
jgi:hypothetical protein